MTSQQQGRGQSSDPNEQQWADSASNGLRSRVEVPNAVISQFDFWDNRYEGRRPFSELLGAPFLVLVAVGGGLVNGHLVGKAIPLSCR